MITQEEVFEQYQARKKKLKTYLFIFLSVLIGLVGAPLVGIAWIPKQYAFISFIVWLLLFLLWTLVWGAIMSQTWSCPACQKCFRKTPSPSFCPQCGVTLKREAKRMELPQQTDTADSHARG